MSVGVTKDYKLKVRNLRVRYLFSAVKSRDGNRDGIFFKRKAFMAGKVG